MVSKTHGLIGVLSIIALVSNLLWLPPALQANYGLVAGSTSDPARLDLAALGQTLSVTSYQSGVLKCNFYENVYANYNDGSSAIVGTNWSYPANPLITQSIVNPSTPTKTINSFSVSLAEMCNNIPSYVTQTTLSGNIQVYAQVSGSDGQQHVLVGGTNVPVASQTVYNGVLMRFYSYTITQNQIAQYNSLTGTNQFTLKVYVQPTLNYVSYFSSDSGLPPQSSVYSGWVTQMFTGNTVNGVTSTTSGSTVPTTTSTPVVTQPTTPTGTQIGTGSVKFFYSLLFSGDPTQYCGTAVPAPATGCIVSPTSGPLSIPLSSFNVIGSTRGTINSLQTFNVEPIMTPSVKGLNINPSTSVVYTGALTIDGKTIPLTSSAITSDQKAFVDSDGNFRFPTATINPVTIDSILKQNGVQPTTPDNLVIRVYATGKFTGTGPSGQFQGILNGPYIDVSVWYLSNSAPLFTTSQQLSSGSTGAGTTNPNCNFGTNPDGTCMTGPSSGQSSTSNPSPTSTTCPAGQQSVQIGPSTFSCITPPTGSGPTASPPTSPPNQCVNVSSGGICLDPTPNPPTTTGNGPTAPSGGPVMFPQPNTNPTTGSTVPSGTCNGTDPTCTNQFNNSNGGTPSFQFDTNTTISIVVGVIAILGIIAVLIYNRKRQ